MTTVTVRTWLVKLAGMPIDGTVWVESGGGVEDAKREARIEHGGNAVAVRLPGGEWVPM